MSRRPVPLRHHLLPLVLAAIAAAGPAIAQPRGESQRESRFDVRAQRNVGVRVQPSADQRADVAALRSQRPDLAVRFNRLNGTVRHLGNHTGHLTGPQAGEPRTLALRFLNENRRLLGLTGGDLAEFDVLDEVVSPTGTTHLYLQQRFRHIPVYQGILSLHVDREGRILSLSNHFVPDISRSSAGRSRPRFSAVEALAAAAQHLGVALGASPGVVSTDPGPRQRTVFTQPELSRRDIAVELRWLAVNADETRLVWNLAIEPTTGGRLYEINVDGEDGEVWTRFDLAERVSYKVYERPVENPDDAFPAPPQDARTVAVDPEDLVSSPLGWHDDGTLQYSLLRGNNAYVFADRDGDDLPDTGEPACTPDPGTGELVCDFPLDLSLPPGNSIGASVTNAFYWVNLVHDIQMKYGFDEFSGNLQETNFSSFGLGGDALRVEVQNNADLPFSNDCFAVYLPASDGTAPRLELPLCENPPGEVRDGSFDNTLVVHEVAHAISTRQVAGPSTGSCLLHEQSPAEGWSDWIALVYTAAATDFSGDTRTVGLYYINELARSQLYSDHPLLNTLTYESVSETGAGEVWAQALWEVYWDLVAKHGFADLASFDVNSPTLAAGNQRALFYVNEGMKNTGCLPTLVDARDALVQAVIDFDADDVCTVWGGFAGFGLGIDANDGGDPDSTAVTNGFRQPASCDPDFGGSDAEICLGESVTIGLPALPDTTYLWSTGETTAQITVSPTTTTTYTVDVTDAFGTRQDSVVVTVADCRCGLDESFENDLTTGWTATGLWHLTDSSPCAAPEDGFLSPTHAYYYGQDSTCTFNTGVANSGTLTSPLLAGITASSTLEFQFLREVESVNSTFFDRTTAEVVEQDGTVTTVFERSGNDPSLATWTSSGQISLGQFAGKRIRIRFRFDTRDSLFNDFKGWYIDDVVVRAGNASEATFDNGLDGWTHNSTLSTCSTGAFVSASPTLQVASGIVTQPAGDCSIGAAGNALFTAVNTSAGIDDVDFGVCVADSPSFSVNEDSLVSLHYFHGQRSGGNDPNGDFFRVEVSTDAGATYSPLVSIGDLSTHAVWSTAGLFVPAGSNVRLRVQASDASPAGDHVEGGIDNVRICPIGTQP